MTCPVEAVFGPDDDARYPCTYGIGHDGPHSWAYPKVNPPSAADLDDCDCPFDYPYTCPACGRQRVTNHCPHDGVQNPCPECGWTDPGKRTPLQVLGFKDIPGEEK